MNDSFPDFIRALPAPDTTAAITAHLASSAEILTMFYEAAADLEVAEHAHGAQWGVVINGEMDLDIGGIRGTYRSGDTYFVPAGVPHTAWLKAGYVGIDVFADADRYGSANGTSGEHDD